MAYKENLIGKDLENLVMSEFNDLYVEQFMKADGTAVLRYSSQTERTKIYVEHDDPDMESGIIVMWSGAIADIPDGFVLCDGNNSTPDLRDKFIVGAKQDDAGLAKTNVKGLLQQSDGATTHKHEVGEHVHSFYYGVDAGEDGTSEAVDFSIGETDYNDVFDTGDEVTSDGYILLPPFYALAYIMKT